MVLAFPLFMSLIPLNPGWNESSSRWVPLPQVYEWKACVNLLLKLVLPLTHLRVSFPGKPTSDYLFACCLSPPTFPGSNRALWSLLVLQPAKAVPHTGSCSIPIMLDPKVKWHLNWDLKDKEITRQRSCERAFGVLGTASKIPELFPSCFGPRSLQLLLSISES